MIKTIGTITSKMTKLRRLRDCRLSVSGMKARRKQLSTTGENSDRALGLQENNEAKNNR